MKFGDKLIILRKRRGLSQEELAEKLNVSRQSVSKWESNNTYPETEKIVQICNLFNCSMDDLINDKVIDIEQVERKEKSNLSINIDSLLDFITKTIDMFASMTFGSGLKCVIELVIVACIMALGGLIAISIATGLLQSLLSFVRNNYFITNFISSLLGIVWFIISVICLIHIFKIRYLDYYEQALNDKKTDNDSLKANDKKYALKDKNIDKVNHKEKVQNVVIRDSNDEPFAFLSSLSKVVIWFIKFWAWLFNFGAICVLFSFIVVFVILVPFSFNSMLFMGINVAVLAAAALTLLLIILLFQFIFDKKVNVKLTIILFVSCVVFGAIGSGIGVLGLKDIEVKDISASDSLVKYEEKIYYSDNLYIGHYGYDVLYVADETIASGDIFVSTNYDERLFKVNSHYSREDGMRGYTLHAYSNLNFKNIYDIYIKNLKNNIIVDYESEFDVITVKANQETIDKLMNNLSKIYLYESNSTADGIVTSNYEYKVEIDGYECSSNYDALSDTMKISSPYCKCERRTIDTYKGTKIIYNCGSTEEDVDDDYYDE